MPEVKNLDHLPVLMEAVVNPDRRMKNPSNHGTSENWQSKARKLLKQFNVIQESCPKSLRRTRAIGANVVYKDL
jgi:hypothetical protein